MEKIFYLIAAVLFAIVGLVPVFDWNLGEFNAVAWGLCAVALGLLVDDLDGRMGRHSLLHD